MLQHPVPEQHLKSIGDITVSFALLESQIQSLIGSMLNERQRIGQIVTVEWGRAKPTYWNLMKCNINGPRNRGYMDVFRGEMRIIELNKT